MSAVVTSSTWQGHKAPVSCLDVANNNLLLSGSEDRTARLWDVRDPKRRASLCIAAPAQVFAVKFAPQSSVVATHDDAATEVQQKSPFATNHTIYLSMEHVVLEYDLRNTTGPIVSTPTRDLSPILQNQDEVNQIDATYFHFQPQRKGKGNSGENQLYLAAADDAGTIRFMEATSTRSQVLHHDPHGVAVVPTCAFRPGTRKSMELASGGTDCKIHLWDLSKPKRPMASFVVQQPESTDTNNRLQLCNPPMVHSLAWSPTGKLLAAGLGDGTIPIFSIDNRSLVQTAYLLDGHDSSVASIQFPSFANNNERLVLSGGSDGSIVCWDIGTNVMELATTTDPTEIFAERFFLDSSTTNPMTNLTKMTNELSLGTSKTLFAIPHQVKINWMTTSDTSIFVADTSNVISEYILPLR